MKQSSISNQSGFVSLLTVTFASILILVLTLGMARLMAGELHQATDSSDSIKSYYVAQGAAEDAAQQLRVKLATVSPGQLSSLNQGCDSDTPIYNTPAESSNQTVNCVQVVLSSTQINAQAGVNETNTYDLSNSVLTYSGYITRLVLSWDDLSASGGSFTSASNGVGSSWQGTSDANQPPVMEMGITNYYPDQNTNVSTQQSGANANYSGELVLSPQCVSSGCPAPNPSPQSFQFPCHLLNVSTTGCPGSDPTVGSPLVQVQCNSNTAGTKRCSAEIDNIVPPSSSVAGYSTVVTLTPLFHAAQYSLTAYAANQGAAGVTCQEDNQNNEGKGDCLAPIALDDAQIDASATVGTTNRRVQLEVPVRSEPQGLNEVLQGDSDICKSFDILSIPTFTQVAQPTGSDNKPACQIAN